MTPEELVDQNLNVEDLFREDTEGLSPDESRALNIIARRGYDGDPFDVAEIDDKISEKDINSLLSKKRLIVRSGSKYNVYWDIFRDFLIEGHPPTLAESFLLRQFPHPCTTTLEFLIKKAPCTINDILQETAQTEPLTEGTALNRVRELRYLGAITKVNDKYKLRTTIQSLEDFKGFITERMNAHIVVRALSRITNDVITHEDVETLLRFHFKGYNFSDKTWATYASYMIAWLRYCGIDFGRRLSDTVMRTGEIKNFTPQKRPDNDIDVLLSLREQNSEFVLTKAAKKCLYDLKALGLVTYLGKSITLTKRGKTILQFDDNRIRYEIARFALEIPKIRTSYDAYQTALQEDDVKFEEALEPLLSTISSASYREVTTNILKSWARFISSQTGETEAPQLE